jgi:hypothetical protein
MYRNNAKRAVLCIALSIVSPALSGRVIYVDQSHPQADDSNPGTESLPWLHIPRGLSAVEPGDTLYIKGSADPESADAIYQYPQYNSYLGRSFYNGLDIMTPGTADNHIIIEAYPGHTVILQSTGGGRGMLLDNASHYEIRGFLVRNFQFAAQCLSDYSEDTVSDLTIEDCEFTDIEPETHQQGLKMYHLDGFTMRDVYVHHNWETGVLVRYSENVLFERVRSNYNSDEPAVPGAGDGDGIACTGTDNFVCIDCEAIGNSEDGFDITANGALINCIAQDSYAYNVKVWRRVEDGYAPKIMYISNCIIANANLGGLYVTQAAELHLYNTLIYGNGEEGLRFIAPGAVITEPVYSTVVNNIIAGNGYNPPYYHGVWSAGAMNVVDADHNLYYQNKLDNVGLHSDTNIVTSDPLFVDVGSNNFHLQSGSPAIDAGIVIDGYHNPNPGDNAGDGKVWYGSAPDIGAYEVALSAIADLLVSGTSQNSVTLAWTVPGGEGLARRPTHYDIRFSGSSLTDATWDTATQVEGEPVPGDFGDEQSFTITGLSSGTPYYIAVKTGDELGNTSWLSNVVSGTTTTGGNHAPVMGPIGDQSVFETQELKLVVSATDADGDPLVYSATRIPTGASFDSATRTFSWTPMTTQSGTYRVTFQVSDGQVTVSQTITTTVNECNQPPIANAGPDQTVTDSEGNGSEQVALNGSGSTDPDGTIQSYAWSEGSSQITTGANPTVALSLGQHTITLTVTNNGGLTDTDTVTITVSASSSTDNNPPSVTGCSPQADAIQVPVNNLVTLHIVDTGKGVDANSVSIKVNNATVYSGNTTHYSSQAGDCRRMGTKADYTFTYQLNVIFDFEQEVTVTVNASDLGGNAMAEYTYSFWTQMRSFGKNKKVSSGLEKFSCAGPATVRDSAGNIWVVWQAGPAGSRDIYVSKLTEGADTFGNSIPILQLTADQCNPAIALDGNDRLYVVWQDNRRGNWDIYMSSSADGINWSPESRVSDSNNNEINPAIAIDGSSPSRAYVVWQDDRAGNQDIYIATSSDGFATKTVLQITSHGSNQVEPAIAVDSANTIYVVWTDYRNSSTDIYGATSNNGWANVPIVSSASNQSSPVIAAEAAGAILHLLWVDDKLSDRDIYYAESNGLQDGPLAGRSIIDDTSAADQLQPAIAVTGAAGSLKVFACWQDKRDFRTGGDTDLYFVSADTGGGTNVFVGDDGTNANQSEPAMGVDGYGHPYIAWSDSRNANPQIYYAGSTYLNPQPLASQLVSASVGAIVGTRPENIDSVDDVSVIIPPGACSCDLQITISKVKNPQEFAAQCLAVYDFGPSGVQFNQPVKIMIPYTFSGGSPKPYWFNSLTGALSQQGMTNIQDMEISPTLHVLCFETTHFTPFYVVLGTTTTGGGGGGGGGGCALSNPHEGSIAGFFLPYGALALLMFILKWRDRRYKAG